MDNTVLDPEFLRSAYQDLKHDLFPASIPFVSKVLAVTTIQTLSMFLLCTLLSLLSFLEFTYFTFASGAVFGLFFICSMMMVKQVERYLMAFRYVAKLYLFTSVLEISSVVLLLSHLLTDLTLILSFSVTAQSCLYLYSVLRKDSLAGYGPRIVLWIFMMEFLIVVTGYPIQNAIREVTFTQLAFMFLCCIYQILALDDVLEVAKIESEGDWREAVCCALIVQQRKSAYIYTLWTQIRSCFSEVNPA